MSFRVYSSKSFGLGLIIISLLSLMLCASSVYSRKMKEIYKHVAGHRVPNADLCPHLGHAMKVMILISSLPDHVEARMGIRHTWGAFAQRRDVGLAFVVALPEEDYRNVQVRSELDMYGDMILAPFVDSQRNQTLKILSTFEWVNNYCSGVPFVLNADDYTFVNVRELLKLIEEQSDVHRAIFGRTTEGNWVPFRNRDSEYYVSVEDYPHPTYPIFMKGSAFLFTGDTIHDLYHQTLEDTYIPLQNVLITGVVPEKIGVRRINTDKFIVPRYNEDILASYNVCNIRKDISIQPINSSKMMVLWEKLYDTSQCTQTA